MNLNPLTVAVLLTVVWGTASASAQTAPTTALIVGSALDLTTTLRALQQPNTREGNPLLAHGGTPGLVAGKVVCTAGMIWVMHRLAQSGHPTAAKVLGYSGGFALTSIAIRNARLR